VTDLLSSFEARASRSHLRMTVIIPASDKAPGHRSFMLQVG